MDKPQKIFFDTCFYIDLFHGDIDYPQALSTEGPCLIVGNALVFMELHQGVRTQKENRAICEIQNSLMLVGPCIESYLEAGPILKKMTDKGWLVPKRLYEMQNDVLLALSAIENNSWIVTRNKKDFEKIKKLCSVNVMYY